MHYLAEMLKCTGLPLYFPQKGGGAGQLTPGNVERLRNLRDTRYTVT
jgi:hypothetical protein